MKNKKITQIKSTQKKEIKILITLRPTPEITKKIWPFCRESSTCFLMFFIVTHFKVNEKMRVENEKLEKQN